MNRTSRRIVDVIVIGRPQQKGSKRAFATPRPGGGVNVRQVEANQNAKPWQHAIAATISEHRTTDNLVRGPVVVTLRFYFKRPKSHYRTGRNAAVLKDSAPDHMITTPDVDKLARTALDALTGSVIADDAQVISATSDKRYGEPERLEIIVVEIEKW